MITMDQKERPFFSIVLPTKNRSEIIGTAIDSILSQNYTDFELVISDNDDTENTHCIIKKYSDKRIKYFRTGNLSMSENWNYAYEKSTGEYILLIEDKYVLKPGSLEILYNYIQKYSPYVISWGLNHVSMTSPSWKIISGTKHPIEYTSHQILNWLLQMNFFKYWKFFHTLPRGSNSCIKRSLYTKIIEKTSMISMENAPDFTQGYQILFNCDRILNLDLTLTGIFTKDKKYSIGAQHDTGDLNTAKAGMNSKSTSITTIKYQPLKIINSETIIIEDFIRTSERYGLEYTFDDFNCKNYYTTIYANTIYRQTEADKNNKNYFKDLRNKIKLSTLSQKRYKHMTTYMNFILLDIGYYPLLIIIKIYRKYQLLKNKKSWE